MQAPQILRGFCFLFFATDFTDEHRFFSVVICVFCGNFMF